MPAPLLFRGRVLRFPVGFCWARLRGHFVSSKPFHEGNPAAVRAHCLLVLRMAGGAEPLLVGVVEVPGIVHGLAARDGSVEALPCERSFDHRQASKEHGHLLFQGRPLAEQPVDLSPSAEPLWVRLGRAVCLLEAQGVGGFGQVACDVGQEAVLAGPALHTSTAPQRKTSSRKRSSGESPPSPLRPLKLAAAAAKRTQATAWTCRVPRL